MIGGVLVILGLSVFVSLISLMGIWINDEASSIFAWNEYKDRFRLYFVSIWLVLIAIGAAFALIILGLTIGMEYQ